MHPPLGAFSSVVVATFVSLFVATSGCARLVPLRRDQLAALTAQPRADTMVISQDGERVVVEARQAPELELRLDCGFWERLREPALCNGGTLSGPLDRFHVDGDLVRVHPAPGRTYGPPALRGVARSPEGDHVVELARVADVRLYLRHYERPDWRPRWGLGVSAAGPSLLMSITGQFRPARWLALELGAMPPGPGVLAGWAGGRVLAPRLGRFQPFAGGFAFGAAMTGERSAGPGPPAALAGARVGVEFVFPSAQHAIALEGNVMRRLDDATDKFITCAANHLCPWGGMSFAYLW